MRSRIIPFIVLILLLSSALTIFVSCKKKDQPENAEQMVSTDTVKDMPTPEKITEAGTSDKINLRILYAGLLDTDRAKDFVNFLNKYFEHVGTIDYLSFKEEQTAGFDVTIIDHNGVGFRTPLPNISRQYSRATVTVGVPGAFICSRLSLKTGYL